MCRRSSATELRRAAIASRRGARGGFTLVELIVAQLILSVIIASSLGLYLAFAKGVFERRSQSSQLGAAAAIRSYLTYRVQTLTNVPGQPVGNTVRVVDGGAANADSLVLLGSRVEPEFAAPASVAWISQNEIGFQALVEERCESMNPDLTTCPAISDRDYRLVCATPPGWNGKTFYMYATAPGMWGLVQATAIGASAYAINDSGWQDNPGDLTRSLNDCRTAINQTDVPPVLAGTVLPAAAPPNVAAMVDPVLNPWFNATASVVTIEAFSHDAAQRLLSVEVDFSGTLEPIGESIEDFQVALGIEEDGVTGLLENGTATDEWWGSSPVAETFPATQDNLLGIRIGVTMGFPTRDTAAVRPALFNRIASVLTEEKTFSRFSTTVALRNRGQ